MRALVTGAAGFVGSHLAKRLCRDGHEVFGLDSFTPYYDVSLKRINADEIAEAGTKLIEGDINTLELATVLDGIDVVFHIAGQPGVRASWGDEFSTYTACNIEATQKLLEACKGNKGLRRFVYASSSSVYGDAERYPTKETDRPMPVSPYGVTKLAAEHLCSLYAKNFGVPTVSLRYFTVYGPGQRPDMAFTRFALAALRGETIAIYGSGEQTRDFTYVDDVVNANVLAATKDSEHGTVLNVAGGSHSSVNEALDIFRNLAGVPLAISRGNAVAGDVRRTGGDTSAIESTLGWRPTVSLQQGIARQFEWAGSIAAARNDANRLNFD